MTNDLTDISEQRALEMNPEQLASIASKLSQEQVVAILHLLTEDRDPLWSEKTQALVNGISDLHQLEVVGNALSPQQAISLFEQYSHLPETQCAKLLPLLVGMSHEVFCHLLRRALPHQLNVLKKESITEPVQHHLNLLANEMIVYTNDLWNAIDAIELELLQQNVPSIGFAELTLLTTRNEQLANGCLQAMKKLDKALAIAWNTDRVDLIEKLSKIKEQCQRSLLIGIGHPRTDSEPATGLYETLEKSLYTIYGDAADPKDIQALHDEDPAIDALIKFSIWYLQDYVELGLIPEIEHAEQLTFKGDQSDEEHLSYTKKLFQAARQSLEQIGLATVGDLKRAGIFSEKTLREYIAKH